MEQTVLPPMRSDLNLFRGPALADGAPTWTLHDPLSNKFFRLGEVEYGLLKFWHGQSPEKLIECLYQQMGFDIQPKKIKAMLHFLESNQLLRSSHKPQIDKLRNQFNSSGKRLFQQTFSHFFFFRIPLFHPEHFLKKTFPLMHKIYTKKFFYSVLFLGLTGLFLTLRQWSLFSSTLVNSLTSEYLYFYFLALVFAKLIHELGHAYTAHYYRCRVANMGIAFMVFWPVLYTETSESWKLSSRRARLHIGASGVLAELILALIATFLWSFFPEGGIRTSLIMLATVTWLSTLLINLNPFMRFDGYYLFSDLIEIPNLQTRAFALARWNLRELLFKYNNARPEHFDNDKHYLLLAYAYSTWLYRFILYLGIALLVYHFVFKLAGIILMAVEISVFIFLPIFREVKTWWQNRNKLHWNTHTLVTFLLFISLLLLSVIPWSGTIRAPAVLSAWQYSQIFSPDAAQVEELKVTLRQKVSKDEVLIILQSPDIEQALLLANKRIQSLEWEINQAGSNDITLRNSRVLQSELLTVMTERQGLHEKRQQLIIKAPFSGTVSHIVPGLSQGRWFSNKIPLLELISVEQATVDAYFREADIAYIEKTQNAEFIADNLSLPPLKLKLSVAETTAVEQLSNLHIASLFGGTIDVVKKQDSVYLPLESVYRWRFTVDDTAFPIQQELRGKVRIPGKKRSLLHRAWQMVLAVVIRESGF
ncbi:MAG: hypothetical protein QNL62_15550 [Gammaproteobacteria bacterium]|nr:hypothetical protein [Gammaproteobacteria bacterium]